MAVNPNAANELSFTRTYDAPRALLFAAWTDPWHIGHWWGPNGFTTTTRAMEVEVGGVWDYVMHGPDGTDYPGRAVYSEIEKPERLVFSHVGGRAEDPHLTCEFRVTFEEAREEAGEEADEAIGARTRLTLRMIFASAEAAGHARGLGADGGGVESLERLAQALDKAAL